MNGWILSKGIYGWPQMMKRATAAEYCDMSVSAFTGEILRGRLPCAVVFGGRDHWHKPALDAALARIAGDSPEPHWERDFWNERPEPEYRRALREKYEKDDSD